MTDWRFITGLITTAALLAVGHLFLWPRRLKLLERYIYGVGSILVGQAIYLGLCEVFWRLAAFAAVGGLVVSALYGYEAIRNLIVRLKTHERDQG